MRGKPAPPRAQNPSAPPLRRGSARPDRPARVAGAGDDRGGSTVPPADRGGGPARRFPACERRSRSATFLSMLEISVMSTPRWRLLLAPLLLLLLFGCAEVGTTQQRSDRTTGRLFARAYAEVE